MALFHLLMAVINLVACAAHARKQNVPWMILHAGAFFVSLTAIIVRRLG